MKKTHEPVSPDYIFETSWEVCNHVGGIYTVLSTRAATMQQEHPDKVIFFGPDWGEHSDIYFAEDKSLFPNWQRIHNARIGRWKIPGSPIAILLRWEGIAAQKDAIYGWAWEKFQVQSHAAYGDYDESSLFGYAAGQVMESLYKYIVESQKSKVESQKSKVESSKEPLFCMHANEWQTAFCLFYIKDHCPKIGTLFTTHATSIGRSIAGNHKPLYDQFNYYNGDQMAYELNMVSKHSAEKQAAHYADCFTTVSDLTARECKQLLDKQPDIVTPNGFEPDFVPVGKAYTAQRKASKEILLRSQNANGKDAVVAGQRPFLLCIAGRHEWKNKGLDVFVDSMRMLSDKVNSDVFAPRVIAYVLVPYLEHSTLQMGKVTVVFVPYYLNGFDPELGETYYNLLCGMDLTVFPSYYEPWGYTPLESIAFHVPTITTSLSGFGVWATGEEPECAHGLAEGVYVIRRSDSNYEQVVHKVADAVYSYMRLSGKEQDIVRKKAWKLSEKAEWKHFFAYYREAYNIALKKVNNK